MDQTASTGGNSIKTCSGQRQHSESSQVQTHRAVIMKLQWRPEGNMKKYTCTSDESYKIHKFSSDTNATQWEQQWILQHDQLSKLHQSQMQCKWSNGWYCNNKLNQDKYCSNECITYTTSKWNKCRTDKCINSTTASADMNRSSESTMQTQVSCNMKQVHEDQRHSKHADEQKIVSIYFCMKCKVQIYRMGMSSTE